MKYKLLLDENDYLTGFVHTETSEDTYEMNPSSMDLGFINCYKLVDNSLIFDEEKKAEVIKAKEEEELAEKEKATHLAKLVDSVKVTREPSDKLGFDWLVYHLGEMVFLKEYVPSESHQGTEDDPIPFELGLELIPNAFYLYNEEKWVWMGAREVATEYPNEDNFSWAKWTV